MRRVRITFAVLVATAILAVGTLGRALAWPSSPAAGLVVASSGIVAAAAAALALRILVVVDRQR